MLKHEGMAVSGRLGREVGAECRTCAAPVIDNE